MKKRVKSKLPAVKMFRAQPYDPNISYRDGVPVPEVLIDMVDAYQLHPFVYSAVNIIASNFAQVGYEIWFKDNEGEWVIDEKHPFRRLLELPNPFQSGYDLRELSAISLEMTGNCYWGLERDKKTNIPTEIWLLPSHMVRIVSSPMTPFDRYIYTVDNKDIIYDAKDIIHFQYANPKSMIYGQSSVLASREDLTTDIFASMWNKNFFKNSARPEAILETDKILDEGVRQRMMNSWKALHNNVKNAHKLALLEAGTKYKDINPHHKDMEFVLQRKLSRETIYGVFNVPPAIAGILEYSNYANMKEQNKVFWQYTMLPKIKKFEATLTNRLRNITFRQLSVVQAEKELIEALRPDLQTLSQTAKLFVDMGIPLNEVIEKLDLPFGEVEGGDVSRPAVTTGSGIPLTVPQGSAKAMTDKEQKDFEGKMVRGLKWKSYDTELTKWENYFKGILKSYFKVQKRRVMANLNRETNKGIIDKIKTFLIKKPVSAIQVEFLFDEKKEVSIMENTVAKPIKKIVIEFANRTGRLVDKDFDFDFVDPKAIDWLNSKVMKISKDCNAYTMERISQEVKEVVEDAVREGYSEGESIEQIVDRIDNVYDFAVEGRAQRIAVTESASASNFGNNESMRMTGVTKKEWLATHDSHTRESHAELDGQIVGVDEMFYTINGNKLMFPADTDNAPPEETVNCRCTILPVLENED